MKKKFILNHITILVFIAYACSPTDESTKGAKNKVFFGEFKEVPTSEIRPKGWLRTYLEVQKEGLTGHLEEAGYPFNCAGWGMPVSDTSSWWPYEQTAYWIDGMLTNGYLLSDTFLIKKAKSRIYPVLEKQSQRDNFFIGPDYLKKEGKKYRWVHAVYFRALMREYEVTGKQEVLEAIKNFHLHQELSRYIEVRDQINIENILWAYGKSQDTSLLKLALDIYDTLNYNGGMPHRPVKVSDFLSEKPIYEHGVTYNEVAKLGAIIYLYTGDQKYLAPAVAAYEKIDKYYMMVDGVNVSSEHTHTPVDALQTHETCDIADMTWSMGYLLMATGDATYADKIEKAIFNAAPGAVSSDFKTLQYFSGPNQVLATATSNHNAFFKGNESMSFGPNPFTECCPGNVTRITPNFATRIWMRGKKNGVIASMYAPSEWQGQINGKAVRIEEVTRYPFDSTITFKISTEERTSFPFIMRIPGWCESPVLFINGNRAEEELISGAYFTLERVFSDGDEIKLVLPMRTKFSKWPDQGVAVERGPLVYALKIEEDWQVVSPDSNAPKSTDSFPAYSVKSLSPWNYALYTTKQKPEDQIRVVKRKWNENPWSAETTPIELKIAAKKIESWKSIKKHKVRYEKNVPVIENGYTVWKPKSDFEKFGEFEFTPILPDNEALRDLTGVPIDTITLIPYGSTNLRIAIFPEVTIK